MPEASVTRSKPDEVQFLRLAVQEARRSRSEDDRPHPYVGVVVVRDGQVLASACRGDQDLGAHAEYTALERKLDRETLAGCTIYTTLEPCTTRNHPKVPCADRLIERRVGRVVIGMLDPDQRITGKGVLRLRRAGIAVDLFPPNLMAELEELNRDFTRDREANSGSPTTLGVVEAGITAFYASRDYYGLLRKDAATIDRYVGTAKNSVVLVSVNLMTGIPFNDLCDCLEKKLKQPESSFCAVISLLDPRRRELMAVMGDVLNMDHEDLSRSIRRSLRELVRFKARMPEGVGARLDVRVHPALPSSSAILLDHHEPDGRIQLETKPYKTGLQKSFAFEVMRFTPDGLYDVLARAYDTLLADGQSVETETL